MKSSISKTSKSRVHTIKPMLISITQASNHFVPGIPATTNTRHLVKVPISSTHCNSKSVFKVIANMCKSSTQRNQQPHAHRFASPLHNNLFQQHFVLHFATCVDALKLNLNLSLNKKNNTWLMEILNTAIGINL